MFSIKLFQQVVGAGDQQVDEAETVPPPHQNKVMLSSLGTGLTGHVHTTHFKSSDQCEITGDSAPPQSE